MADWWDDYAEGEEQDAELSRRLSGMEEMSQTMAQEMPPLTEVDVDTLRAPSDYSFTQPPQEVSPVDSGYISDAPPAAVADALEYRGGVGNAINSFFGGIGDRVGGYLDKKFGTSADYAAKQTDLQNRLALRDDPAAMYTPHTPRGFNLLDAGTIAAGGFPIGAALGMVPTALQKMGFDVQDMTPYGFAVMDRDEAAARATSGLPEPSDSSSDDNYIPLGGAPPAAPIKPQSGYAPGMGGSSRSVKFSGYPDFTKANPYG